MIHLITAPDGSWDYRQLTPEQVNWFRALGWQVIESELINTIPAWIDNIPTRTARMALRRVWVWLQDKGVIRL